MAAVVGSEGSKDAIRSCGMNKRGKPEDITHKLPLLGPLGCL